MNARLPVALFDPLLNLLSLRGVRTLVYTLAGLFLSSPLKLVDR